jgi:hypothetical protein
MPEIAGNSIALVAGVARMAEIGCLGGIHLIRIYRCQPDQSLSDLIVHPAAMASF